MNNVTNQKALHTKHSQQQTDIAKVGLVLGAVVMVGGAATTNIPVAISGGVIIASSLWLYSTANGTETSASLSIINLVKFKIESKHNKCLTG